MIAQFTGFSRAKAWGRMTFPEAYRLYLRLRVRQAPPPRQISLADKLEQVKEILCSNEEPRYYDSEEVFNKLQNSYTQWWPDYRYDAYSTWARGTERTVALLALPGMRDPHRKILDTGCGDGMTGYVLGSYGHEVILNDLEEWRDVRAQRLRFVPGDLCAGLALDDDEMDLVLSYNAFEHITDPAAALTEMIRVCRPGGYIYIDFCPLFCSPLGLHAFSFLMPYPHFAFSAALIDRKVREIGIEDLGQVNYALQPTNKLRLAYFRQLWKDSGCEVISLIETVDTSHLDFIVAHPNGFKGQGLTCEDVSTSRIQVTLRKPEVCA